MHSENLAAAEVFCLVEAPAGVICAGTYRGVFQLSNDTWQQIANRPRDLVLAMAADQDGALWCGTFRAGLFRVGTDGTCRQFTRRTHRIPDTIVNAVTCDHRGTLWAGTAHGLLRYDSKTWQLFTTRNSALPSDRIHSIAAAVERVWVGTRSGLFEINEGGT